jgi:flagellar protein FlaE/flagellar protein FlaC
MLKGTLKKLSQKQKDDSAKEKKKKKEEEVDMEDGETEGLEEVAELDELSDTLDKELEEESSAKISEFDARIKDIENEVGLISSKLSTIRAENEEIGKRVQEIEENIRKLLGIYEMVTEGINPFATESFASDDGFGLFSFKKENKEDLPDELLSKEPESFFEDVDNVDEIPELENSVEDKFKKLKEELNAEERKQEIKKPKQEIEQQKQVVIEQQKQVVEQHVAETKDKLADEVEVQEISKNVTCYLVQIKRDFVSDIIVLKWMDYLVNTFGIKRMVELLDFYVDIGWISKNVRELLTNYSRGYALKETPIIEEASPSLKDHVKSLIFIAKLSGHELKADEIEKIVKEIEELEREACQVAEYALSNGC